MRQSLYKAVCVGVPLFAIPGCRRTRSATRESCEKSQLRPLQASTHLYQVPHRAPACPRKKVHALSSPRESRQTSPEAQFERLQRPRGMLLQQTYLATENILTICPRTRNIWLAPDRSP
ncbi:hypothetical protein DPEC_G00020090 [Dallia pectoralis]|uniref:Uncharacterized protein n=1 Tax=Dallia pectoralis TaxID=75939 RepID=A0ACC2HG65_DALPE|nr:hypothetical protein DPEC_G00020090 [Dallia pectoralis]